MAAVILPCTGIRPEPPILFYGLPFLLPRHLSPFKAFAWMMPSAREIVPPCPNHVALLPFLLISAALSRSGYAQIQVEISWEFYIPPGFSSPRPGLNPPPFPTFSLRFRELRANDAASARTTSGSRRRAPPLRRQPHLITRRGAPTR